jgi:hypothetical protein
VSIFAYVLGKETSEPDAAVRAEIALGERASWPAFRTLARLRRIVYPVAVQVTHSSLIAKARSVALGTFLDSGAPRWLSIDDDVEARDEDLCKLLKASEVDVLLAACPLRTTPGEPARLNLVVDATGARVRDADGVRVFSVECGGLALSVLTRRAAEVLDEGHPELRFVDAMSGRRGLGVYLEEVKNGGWWGEDFAFCRRARDAGLRVEALCDSCVTHAGITATVDPRFFTQGDY